ncbi:hypothetical protein MKZ38_010229 [Zalerion maritima]|uniref:Uncharacterized protein n=1 Tax=Zalerion maritima TaxID=339359 RepID=A0AAD5RTU4_9PEZI|nr:hypothetical protein MKZ38_010229 [Zalerion maritima]
MWTRVPVSGRPRGWHIIPRTSIPPWMRSNTAFQQPNKQPEIQLLSSCVNMKCIGLTRNSKKKSHRESPAAKRPKSRQPATWTFRYIPQPQPHPSYLWAYSEAHISTRSPPISQSPPSNPTDMPLLDVAADLLTPFCCHPLPFSALVLVTSWAIVGFPIDDWYGLLSAGALSGLTVLVLAGMVYLTAGIAFARLLRAAAGAI